jgi:hypothetical protein
MKRQRDQADTTTHIHIRFRKARALLRTRRLLLAALRVWELKHRVKD